MYMYIAFMYISYIIICILVCMCHLAWWAGAAGKSREAVGWLGQRVSWRLGKDHLGECHESLIIELWCRWPIDIDE